MKKIFFLSAMLCACISNNAQTKMNCKLVGKGPCGAGGEMMYVHNDDSHHSYEVTVGVYKNGKPTKDKMVPVNAGSDAPVGCTKTARTTDTYSFTIKGERQLGGH